LADDDVESTYTDPEESEVGDDLEATVLDDEAATRAAH